jgi:hypothetical protein
MAKISLVQDRQPTYFTNLKRNTLFTMNEYLYYWRIFSNFSDMKNMILTARNRFWWKKWRLIRQILGGG